MSSSGINREISAALLERPLSFGEFMELSLYGEQGYYTKHVRIGGEGADFYTSAQSPLFGSTLAQYILKAWCEVGSPQDFQIVEIGAGQGELATNICQYLDRKLLDKTQMNYVIVEKSSHMQASQQSRLGQVDLSHVSVSWGEPRRAAYSLIIANEVLDALPVERMKRTQGGWLQAYVRLDEMSRELVLYWDQPAADAQALAEQWLPIDVGQEGEISLFYQSIFEQCKTYGEKLQALFIDYGITLVELAAGVRPQGTVRGYFQHRIVDPLWHPGHCDITADANWDAAEGIASKIGFKVSSHSTQGRFLMNAGLMDVYQELLAQRVQAGQNPMQQAQLNGQVKQLTFPGGMGERFEVLELKLE